MQLGLCNWKNTQPCVIKCLLQAHPTRLAWALVWEASHATGMGQCWDGAAPGWDSAHPTDVSSFPGMAGEEMISPWCVEGAA